MIFSHTILIRSFSFTFPGKLLREFWRHSLGTAAPVCAAADVRLQDERWVFFIFCISLSIQKSEILHFHSV